MFEPINAVWPALLVILVSLSSVILNILSKKIGREAKIEVDEIAEIVNTKKKEDEEARKTVKEYLNAFYYSTNDLDSSITIREKPNQSYANPYDDNIKKIIEELNNSQKEDDPGWKLVQTMIKGYHKQALVQANVQFYISIVAAVIGLMLLSYTILSSNPASEKALSSIPVVITEGIAALFFRQAEQTRQRATDLYDRLREDNVIDKSIKLINSIENLNLRAVVKAQLALKMGSVESTVAELSTLIKEQQQQGYNS